jgi:malonyl-CoA O-methyltransferase
MTRIGMHSQKKPRDSEAQIVDSFSKYAKSYDRHAQLQKTMAERLASMLPEPLPGCVTELGCGTGVFTRHLLAHPVETLVLNDISASMMDHLKERLTLPENTKLIIGNAERTEFYPTDLIVGNAVFQWFAEPQKTLNHLLQYMNPKGGLIFSTFGPGTLKEFRETGSLESPNALYSEIQWKTMIERAGLVLKESHVELRKSFFPNTRALIRNLQQIGAAPFRLLKPGGLRKLIREYDEKFMMEQGVYVTWEILYFSTHR